LALAKAHRLDRQIMDFIPQHHGTSQIEYFYRKALKLEEEQEEEGGARDDVKEETYRYPGPKPQTKEAGIVMLADSCEATARTLEDPTHQRFKDTVLKIINKKLFDGQLDETALTLGDLHVIAERFTTTLVSVHHARIAYPDPMGGEKEKKEAPRLQ
jgi:membrane-associated HD superfamily phosphohydrolase